MKGKTHSLLTHRTPENQAVLGDHRRVSNKSQLLDREEKKKPYLGGESVKKSCSRNGATRVERPEGKNLPGWGG